MKYVDVIVFLIALSIDKQANLLQVKVTKKLPSGPSTTFSYHFPVFFIRKTGAT